jgi:hypothetical protein
LNFLAFQYHQKDSFLSKVHKDLYVSISVFSGTDPMIQIRAKISWIQNTGKKGAVIRVSSETSFVSYFAKHETKQVSCFTKQTCCFAKFRYEAKQAVSYVFLFFKQNKNARFACVVTNFYQILSYIKKIGDVEYRGPQIIPTTT